MSLIATCLVILVIFALFSLMVKFQNDKFNFFCLFIMGALLLWLFW